MSQTFDLPYRLEKDESGAWCASAVLRSGVAAFGEGDTEQEALADLREGILGLIEAMGMPNELMLDVA